MSDDYDKYELWDEDDDGPLLFTEDEAWSWGSTNIQELREALEPGQYETHVIDAHRDSYRRAAALVAKARERLDQKNYAEAVFNASRALEGYVRAVYLRPLISVMTAGITVALKTPPDLAREFMPAQIKNARFLLLLAFSVLTGDEAEAKKKRTAVLATFDSEGPWRARNEADHTFDDISEAMARAMVDHAEARLPVIAEIAERQRAARDAPPPPRKPGGGGLPDDF